MWKPAPRKTFSGFRFFSNKIMANSDSAHATSVMHKLVEFWQKGPDRSNLNKKRDVFLQEAPLALRGERLPKDYANGLLYCAIHGIRHNEAFAKSPEVVEQCKKITKLARARNARLIMSNQVPNMETDDAKPYCFWHPDTPNEKTLRELAKRYPDRAYLVGRACAVGGYHELYHELDLLPEVSIAEEARDQSSNNPGSKAIFDHIMEQPVCYAVLDDYTRTIKKPRCPAFMNGDTAVRSTLDMTLRPEYYWRKDEWERGLDPAGEDNFPFDMLEDDHIGLVTTDLYTQRHILPREHVNLLYSPLPLHLPTIVKDPLIIMAAYEGNLDRYLRLRRPQRVLGEHGAILRGIHHNTTFARWFSQEEDVEDDIRAATLARFIMVNDLSRITKKYPEDDEHIPGMIWWPLIPAKETLETLAKRRPDMLLQVAMACIAGNYKELWNKLAPKPYIQLWDMATCQRDPSVRNYFVEYLERRAAELGIKDPPGGLPELDEYTAHDWCWNATRIRKEPFFRHGPYYEGYLPKEIRVHGLNDGRPEHDNIYGYWMQSNLAAWELHIASTEEMRAKIPDNERGLFLYTVAAV